MRQEDPKSWDVSDAIEQGWTTQELLTFITVTTGLDLILACYWSWKTAVAHNRKENMH